VIDGLPIGGLGVLGVVALTGWSLAAFYMRGIMSGRLHTQAEFDRMEREHSRELDDISHDRNEWRTQCRLNDAQLAERDRQLQIVTQIGETTRRTLEALNASLPGGRRQESP
jgi:hypothetical protein